MFIPDFCVSVDRILLDDTISLISRAEKTETFAVRITSSKRDRNPNVLNNLWNYFISEMFTKNDSICTDRKELSYCDTSAMVTFQGVFNKLGYNIHFKGEKETMKKNVQNTKAMARTLVANLSDADYTEEDICKALGVTKQTVAAYKAWETLRAKRQK